MSPVEIVEAVLAAGGDLVVNGNRIHYQIPERAAPLLDELRRPKPNVLSLLKLLEQRKAVRHLVPFMGKRVWTPDGTGRLVKLGDHAGVEFKNSAKLRWYDPTAIIPYA